MPQATIDATPEPCHSRQRRPAKIMKAPLGGNSQMSPLVRCRVSSAETVTPQIGNSAFPSASSESVPDDTQGHVGQTETTLSRFVFGAAAGQSAIRAAVEMEFALVRSGDFPWTLALGMRQSLTMTG
jgi:hypothetical protein